MTRLLLGRLLRTALAVLGALSVVFLLLHMSGDPARLLLPEDATGGEIAELRSSMGLDDPFYRQWFRFLLRAVRGDFGDSFMQRRPALDVLMQRLPATGHLALVASLLAVGLACPLGVTAAVRRGGALDRISVAAAACGRSMPSFWVGIMLIMIFSVRLSWFPVSGRGGPLSIVLPAVTLALYMAPMLTRLVRSAVLEVLGEDHVRTARSKGLSERVVLYRHALRNAAIPVVTVLGLQVGALLGGAAVTETVFAWPGIGRLLVTSAVNLDYPLVLALTAFVACSVALVNLSVDILYGFLDPRVRG